MGTFTSNKGKISDDNLSKEEINKRYPENNYTIIEKEDNIYIIFPSVV